jgi:uncharacterized repeat protein (TIGR01451 family)
MPLNTTSYEDQMVDPGETIIYTVRVRRNGVWGALSAPVTIQIPTKPLHTNRRMALPGLGFGF